MKILLATSKAIPSGGGIASYNQELVNLLGKDNEISLLTDSDEFNVNGYVATYRTYGHSNNDFEYCRKLVEHINSSSYDCIINSTSAFIPVLAPFLTSRIISVSHFVDGKFAINAGYNVEYQNAIIALSEYGKRFIINKFNIIDPDKIKVVYNFVNLKKTSNLIKINNDPLKIVYPGGTSISKSVDVVQQLVYRLLASDLDFEFYWLGGTKLPISKLSLLGLHEITDLFPKDSRLIITGLLPREKAMDLIESANIFLLPSRGEGCPMTLLEAMSGGCIPIVSDAKHGSREILEMSRAGYIVKQGESKELYSIISEIITNHTDYIHLYSKSYEFLVDNLSEEIWGKQMKDILMEVCKEGKRSINLCKNKFDKVSKDFQKLCKLEDVKLIVRNLLYRGKFDISYIKNRINQYK